MPRCIGPSRSAHTGIHRELPPAETDGFLWICGLVSGGLDWLHDSHPATEVNAAFDPGFLLSQKPRSRSQDMARRPGQRKRRSVAPPTRFCLPWSHLPQRFLTTPRGWSRGQTVALASRIHGTVHGNCNGLQPDSEAREHCDDGRSADRICGFFSGQNPAFAFAGVIFIFGPGQRSPIKVPAKRAVTDLSLDGRRDNDQSGSHRLSAEEQGLLAARPSCCRQ